MASGAGAPVIRVLQVLEATEGGTRRHLRDLVGALDPAAFGVTLAVSCGRDPAFRDDLAGYAALGVPVREVPMRRGIAPLADVLSLVRLVRLVRRVKPALIHAHSAKAGFLARLAGACCRVPVVYTPHAFPFLMACGSSRQRVYRLLEKGVCGLTAAVIAVSEEDEREALQLGHARERVWLIPNGVAACEAGGVSAREAGELKVAFFGRLTRQKGPDLVLGAAAEVVAHVPQAMFVFYGEGELAQTLRAQAASPALAAHVQFKGAYKQGEAVARMREADVVVVPSRWEGCPYVVLEAFLAGVPVVAAAVGGVPGLIRDGVNGVLVEAGNAEALCDGVLELLRDPAKRGQMAAAGRATVAEYTLERMAAAVSEVYRRVAGRK
jgi:glycosyltransferase involved in cell wall biosynthesis